MDIERHSWLYAVKMHGSQANKYTGEPYVNHSAEVAAIVASAPHTPAMIAASYLHDTVENTAATLEEIRFFFGEEVAELVEMVTDISKPEDGNRLVRKTIDLHHAAKASPSAQTIKLADMISNTVSIVEHDPVFAKTYLVEKYRLLQVLKRGDKSLWNSAYKLVLAGMRKSGLEQSVIDRVHASMPA